MVTRRDKPYIWVTWISGLLAGEKQCKWAAWHRIHFNFTKTPSDFDNTSHKIKHTALRDALLKDLRGRECEIVIEQKLKIEGKHATLCGSVDVVAVADDRGVVFEIKSGKENPADKAQLMIYMWALKRAYKRYENMLLDGMLVYPEKRVRVSAVEIDEDFCRILKEFITDLIHNEPDRRFPSSRDCKYCNVAECEERFSGEHLDDDLTSYIPDFL